MKVINGMVFFVGIVMLVLALGFIFQIPIATILWPWPDGRLSYLFIGSILAAASAAVLWIGWTGEPSVLPAGTLNVLVIALGSSVYFLYLVFRQGRYGLLPYGFIAVLSAFASGIVFLWSRRLPFHDARPTPLLVRISFGIFVAVLILAGIALILRAPIFPWTLNPDSSVLFGTVFVGDAFYFLHGLFYPRWHNARGQLLSFLAYDLVLIGPFLRLFRTIDPALKLNLIVYVLVLVYSGSLAIFYLFLNERTNLRQPNQQKQ
jgi:hypothetical protein